MFKVECMSVYVLVCNIICNVVLKVCTLLLGNISYMVPVFYTQFSGMFIPKFFFLNAISKY
jgi:hypothetical protein